MSANPQTKQPKPNAANEESWLRALAAFVSPLVLGTLIVVCVLTGKVISSDVRESEIISSVALVVGAVLILGPITLYIHRPEEYERLQRSNAEQLQAVLEQLPRLIEERKAIAGTSTESTP